MARLSAAWRTSRGRAECEGSSLPGGGRGENVHLRSGWALAPGNYEAQVLALSHAWWIGLPTQPEAARRVYGVHSRTAIPDADDAAPRGPLRSMESVDRRQRGLVAFTAIEDVPNNRITIYLDSGQVNAAIYWEQSSVRRRPPDAALEEIQRAAEELFATRSGNRAGRPTFVISDGSAPQE